VAHRPAPGTNEYTVAQTQAFPDPAIRAGYTKSICHELDRQHDVLKSIREINFSDRNPDAVCLYSKMLNKEKFLGTGAHDKYSSRLVPFGNNQPPDSYTTTFAPTADGSLTDLMIAATFADATKNGNLAELELFSFDITGAFLHGELTSKNFPRQIIIKLQDDLPHRLAGKWVEVLKPIYGLKQSNAIFDEALRAVFISCGFNETFDDPCIFIKIHPEDTSKSCKVSMHVDDGAGVSSHKPYKDELLTALKARFGDFTYNSNCTSYTGSTITRLPSGAVHFSMAGYITRFIHDLGLDSISPSTTPSSEDLFHAPIDMTPASIKLYEHMIGGLIYILKRRPDIRKEVTFLATKRTQPVRDDLRKVIRVIRYLSSTKEMGPTFFTTEGAILHLHADASFGVHTDGRSQSAFYASIGRHSAPFYSYSSRQTKCVSTNAMEAEYVTLTSCSKIAVPYRRFLHQIGYPQPEPTTIWEDNMSAINLAIAPAISRKSRHIFVRHHFIRDLIKQQVVQLKYLNTNSMPADLLTKPLGPTKFVPLRDKLLNITPPTF